MKIKFIKTEDTIEDRYSPKPADKDVPFWYKKSPSFTNGKKMPYLDGTMSSTVKRCMPVFDAMTAGYLIYSFCDISITQTVSQETGEPLPVYSWPTGNPIGFHPVSQAEFHPANNGFSYPKWNSIWGIKTPPGYSCLFVTPFHRDLPFTILPGVVDTDKYYNPVNFPFVLNNSNFEGIIPAGTPIAQVFPFKRENWKMEFGNKKDLKEQKNHLMAVRNVFFDGYRQRFRQPKEYK
jgi:hypothetical protein